jgi:hypothetical protein
MAKIVETVFKVKLSQLVKDNAIAQDDSAFDELPTTIEQVVQELVTNDVIVEVEKTK